MCRKKENQKKKTIYLDFNCYINALKSNTFKQKLNDMKNNYNFIYSFALAEELHRNSDKEEFENSITDIIKLVNSITGKRCIGPTDENSIIETKKDFFETYRECETFDTDGIVNAQGNLNAKCAAIKSLDEKDRKRIKGLSYKQVFQDKSVNKLVDSYLENKNFTTKNDYESGIPLLCQILCCCGYSTEKNEHTYISGVYDSTHLIYASHADYFLTSDKECSKKAKAIFYYINSNAKAIFLPNPTEALENKVYKVLNDLN